MPKFSSLVYRKPVSTSDIGCTIFNQIPAHAHANAQMETSATKSHSARSVQMVTYMKTAAPDDGIEHEASSTSTASLTHQTKDGARARKGNYRMMARWPKRAAIERGVPSFTSTASMSALLSTSSRTMSVKPNWAAKKSLPKDRPGVCGGGGGTA